MVKEHNKRLDPKALSFELTLSDYFFWGKLSRWTMTKEFSLVNGSDGLMDECESTFDCIFNSSDGSHEVLKLCYIGVREYNFCGCSSWYGFTGVDCNQPSIATRYFTSSLVFILLAGITLLVYSVFALARHIWFIHANSTSKVKLNTGLALLAANIGAALSVITYSSVKLRAFVDPSKFEFVEYKLLLFDPMPDITVKHGNLASAALILSNEFFIVAAMQISVSWIDVATDVWKLLDEQRQRKVKRIKHFIQLLTAISLSSVLICLLARLFFAATFITIINAILLLVMFIYGRWIFLKLLRGIFQQELKERYKKVVILVKHSSLLHIICLGGLMFILTLYYMNFGNVYDKIPVGGFNYVLLLRDLAIILATIMQFADTYYVHKLFSRLRGSEMPSITGSNQIAKEKDRNKKRAEYDATEQSLIDAGTNDKAIRSLNGSELPFTAGLVRPRHRISESEMLDGQSKASSNIFSRVDWEL